MEKQKKEKWKSIRIGWKRSFIVTLVVALLMSGLSIGYLGKKAQAAEYTRIVGIETYHNGGDLVNGSSTSVIKLEDGGRISLRGPVPLSGDFIQTRAYTAGSTTSITKYLYITKEKDLYYQEGTGTATKMASNAVDFTGLKTNSSAGFTSFFVVKTDTTAEAWGKGNGGQLGIGYNQDKTVATKLVDPADTTEDLKGIKKIIPVAQETARNAILFVGDGKVYLIGTAFGYNSFTSGVPLDVTSFFPAFDSADQFDMFLLNNESKDSAPTTVRVFEIKGKQYTLVDLMKYYKELDNFTDISSTTLYPVPDGINARNIIKISGSVNNPNVGRQNRIGYLHLSDDGTGTLTYWGTSLEYFNDVFSLEGYSKPPFSSDILQIAKGVSKVYGAYDGHIVFSKNNNIYYAGTNFNNRSGLTGGAFLTPVKLVGPANELDDLKDFAITGGGIFYLKNDNTLLSWEARGNIYKHPRKYIAIFPYREFNNNYSLIGIGEDYKMYSLYATSNSTYALGSGVKVVPNDYVAPILKPDTPVLSISSLDKFNQSVLAVNYGVTGDIATKQYQINGGGWIDYTGEVVITQSGSVTVQARSADSKGNISDVGELILTNVPIVITAGHPSIDKISGDEFKINAVATGNTKVQVKVDGGTWQDFNVANNLLLTPGAHTVEVRLLNDRDQELINRTFNVTADNPAPVFVSKPVVTQKGLNNQYGLDIEVTYNVADGYAEYSVDGGPWTTTTGSFSVSNAAHTIRSKVVAAGGKESEITEFVTTTSQPKITVNDDQISIDLGINTNDVTVYYKDSNRNQWVEYTGPVTYVPGTHNIEIEVRDRTTGAPVFTGGPYTVTVTGTIPGDGGTTPTPNPGDGTPVGQEDVEFTVNSGGLSARFEGTDLSTIVIDSTRPYQSINSVSQALIEDSRGTGKGYQYSMDVTDFHSESMQDNSTNSQSLVVSIPANALSVDVLNTKTINGPAAELSNVGKHVFTGNGPELLATAKAFEGMGYNIIPLNFTLSVPDRVKIISSGSGSKFVPGESTGLMAGIYKAKLTITLSSGI